MLIKIDWLAPKSAPSLSFAPIFRAINDDDPAAKPFASPVATINKGVTKPTAEKAFVPKIETIIPSPKL